MVRLISTIVVGGIFVSLVFVFVHLIKGKPVETVLPHNIIKVTETKTESQDIDAKIYVTVEPTVTRAELEKLAFKIVQEHYERLQGQGPNIKLFAYYNNDAALKNVVATATQYYGKVITFESNGQTTFDREGEPRVFSRAEKERQEYVNKTGAELFNAATKQYK